MALGYENSRNSFHRWFKSNLLSTQGDLTDWQREQLRKIRQAWNFYEGYHWEDLPPTDTPEIATNYSRAFVDKIVAFELGKGFTFNVSDEMRERIVTNDGSDRTLFQYLEDVWEDNDQEAFSNEMGVMKSVTADAWVAVEYIPPEDIKDVYNEYPNGRINIMLYPSEHIFPEYDPQDRDKLLRLRILYEYEREVTRDRLFGVGILKRPNYERVLYEEVWTDEERVIKNGKDPEIVEENRYDIIPFIRIKNLPIPGRSIARGDLDDIIPLNVEYNYKTSDVSEIIDYHAAPTTIVYGAKIGSLEKGANKMWGGLSKDAKVENLQLDGDLGASTNYIATLKKSMCEVGGVPESVLGGATAISNTSGVALQYINLPLVEKTRIKRRNTASGIEDLNKLILLISLREGLIIQPNDIPSRDFYWSKVTIPDTLPKDELIELQLLQAKIDMGLESRRGALEALGTENIDKVLQMADQDKLDRGKIDALVQAMLTQPGADTPTVTNYNNVLPSRDDATSVPQINSGMLNSQTPQEILNIERSGENVGQV